MRAAPPPAADERTSLQAFLDLHRQTLLLKVDGLDDAQLARSLAPSDLTLGGMLKHLAYVEHAWSRRLAGLGWGPPWSEVEWTQDPDWDWHSARADGREALLTLLAHETDAADAIYAEHDLDDLTRVIQRTGTRVSLRWILLHLIEEYARHNGHADLIRQSIDGVVGE